MVGVTAWFSYKQGMKDGVTNGVEAVLDDLHRNAIISLSEDPETGDVTIERYNES